MKREYRHGTRWCVWRWKSISGAFDTDGEYLLRLHVVQTPLFSICLHWIRKPDSDLYLHDHPVSFLSIVLSGGYGEVRKPNEVRWINWFNWIRATDKHSICAVKPNTLTLCLMGPKVREWGFHTDTGWVFWKDYYARRA